MFKNVLSLSGMVLIIFIFSGCQNQTPVDPGENSASDLTLKKEVVAMANGSGHFTHENGVLRIFTHSAKKEDDGSVQGHFNLKKIGGDGIHLTGSVFCLTIATDVACFGAVIETSDYVPKEGENPLLWQPGTITVWSTEDHGEGNNTDKISLNFTNPAWTQEEIEGWCNSWTPGVVIPYFGYQFFYYWVEQGNIQIKTN